jgi:hypothetical protein
LPTINIQSTILLDAHIDGGNYDHQKTPKRNWCPIYEELKIIKNNSIKNHILIIDDFRLLGKDGWGLEVTVENIIKAALEINEKYEVIIEHDNLIFKEKP